MVNKGMGGEMAYREAGQGCGSTPDGGYECVCGQCNELSYEQLQQQNRELVAALERLRVHADAAITRLAATENPYADVLHRIVKQTPQISLAEIEAAAIEKFVVNCANVTGLEPDAYHRAMAKEYAANLRAGK